jgi:glutamate formiminotransferase
MALPIQPTPILKGKIAKEFEKRIQHDLQIPAYLKPTPKIEEARKAVKQYAVKAQK